MAEVAGPGEALALLTDLVGAPAERWHLYWAARTDFHRRLGDRSAAGNAYRRALDCPCNDSDRRFLLRRRNEMTG